MRSISEIKREMKEAFMNNESASKLYGFEVGSSFDQYFSAVSVESVVLYVFAVCVWVVENMIASHKDELEHRVESMKPHRASWYKWKVMQYMKRKSLSGDSDEYDLSGMSEEEIATLRIVKHVAVGESEDSSLLIIKVAGERGGERQPLSSDEEAGLRSYIDAIKDAGVRYSLVNQEADEFNCEIDVYYDGLMLSSEVEEACMAAIKGYIENLAFNGEYTNMGLVDELQRVEGVELVEVKRASYRTQGDGMNNLINARAIATAGYFKAGRIRLNMQYNGKR